MRKTIYIKNLKGRFHASYGNEKTGGKKQGMLAIGYYPSRGYLYYSNGSLVSDCLGSCSAVDCENCMKKCYAISMVKRYEKACIARIENTMQLREDMTAHFQAIYDTIVKDKIKKDGKRVKLNKEMTCAKCGLCWGKHPNIDIIGCLEH